MEKVTIDWQRSSLTDAEKEVIGVAARMLLIVTAYLNKNVAGLKVDVAFAYLGWGAKVSDEWLALITQLTKWKVKLGIRELKKMGILAWS